MDTYGDISPQVEPGNRDEKLLWSKLQDEGWSVLRKGWPDFFCYKDDNIMLIEVKPSRNHRLKSEQLEILLRLAEKGLSCYRWSPQVGLEQVTGEMAIQENTPLKPARFGTQRWLIEQDNKAKQDGTFGPNKYHH